MVLDDVHPVGIEGELRQAGWLQGGESWGEARGEARWAWTWCSLLALTCTQPPCL